ncbi:RecQ family ATP-dependent DNA helicase [Microbacterium sp. AG238]|uniref:RecQ family ATP-dependent DNA helicase n=1 Tax=Microbacterium sp. AG238 TaxID=2183994 RepID=UPI000FF6E73A|nr:RecQ family ATP-dependent DNA helicase [Microbacterium sp. AG238]RKE64088.1 ATP-dependent DNA helicase RecQ [Microbacterium sp. AG238]
MQPDEIARVARESFGIDELRPQQLDAIEAAVAGRDVMVVWATGAGKSAVYQVAAALRPGLTAIVSPLIALQEDQLARIEEAPDAPDGVALNSSRGARAQREAWDAIRSGEASYVLLAPEQLAKDDVVAELAEAGVSLLVVDEAHCIAAWGHDFRPDYLMLGEVSERLGRPPILALTATATSPVRTEITERLGMDDPAILVGDVDRPNIELNVRRHADKSGKRDAVLDEVAGLPTPGLLYTATRRGAEEYAEALQERGIDAVAYHAGLSSKDRNRVHEAFHDGEVDVVVATSAFGMGIDKADVRFVVHADIPDSIDAYYQELGRAGRDGEPATATLHYRPEDLSLRRFFAASAPKRGELTRLVEAIAGSKKSRAELAAAGGLSARRVTALLTVLVDAGAVRTSRAGVALRRGMTVERAVDAALERSAERERIDASRIEMLRSYAETRRCRRATLLGYFGQDYVEPCESCDTCAASANDRAAREDHGRDHADAPFHVDDVVRHHEWGEGTVMAVEDDRVTVFFESQGYKVLATELVAERGLLEPA